jgi:6-phosphogluconolactonase
VRVVPGPFELAQAGAAHLIRTAESAIADHGYFTLALSGGATPRQMYELIVSSGLNTALDWSSVYIFFSDERMVPPEDEQSNYHMAWVAMLGALPIPEHQIFRVHTEFGSAARAAESYEETLRKVFTGLTPHLVGDFPQLDLTLLGLGDNGHTASLFPESSWSGRAGHAWVISPWVPSLSAFRISLSLEVINASKEILFLVSGSRKSHILSQVMKKGGSLPAQQIRPRQGQLNWLVDKAAAAKIMNKVGRAA